MRHQPELPKLGFTGLKESRAKLAPTVKCRDTEILTARKLNDPLLQGSGVQFLKHLKIIRECFADALWVINPNPVRL